MASELFQVVDDWSKARLTVAEWKRNQSPLHTLHFTYQIQNQAFKIFLELDDASNFVGIFVYAPISVPDTKRDAVCELMMRLNWRLRFGSLQLDHQDGQMRYFHGIDVEGGWLSATMLDNMLGAAGNAFDEFFTLIMRTIYSQESPQELLEEFEEGLVLH
jgi:hypothetical protein